MAGECITDDILNCRDLWVVLENRYGEKYVESYELPNILYSNGEFWGKFRNVHSAYSHQVEDQTQALSYAYNNFSNIVCSCGLTSKIHRYYSSFAYSSLNFIAKGAFRKIWDSNEGGKLSELSESIRGGLRLKVRIESSDGYTYILPAHTVEAFEEKDTFVLETEFDGYPDQIRGFQAIKQFDKKFDESLASCVPPNYPTTGFIRTNEFFLTSFFVSPSGVVQREFRENGKLIQKSFDYDSAQIWVEVL